MMYNTHLQTFISVIEAGSFRGAAEKIGISPSAVLKQISLLEQDLNVAVFDRSRRGVSLTEAGESIYRDAKYIMQYCQGATDRAREIHNRQGRTIRVGASFMMPADPVIEPWTKAKLSLPDLSCRFTLFENTQTGMERAFSTIGQDADIIVSVYDDAFLKKYGLKGLRLQDVPLIIASPFGETAADSTYQSMEDLSGKTILVPAQGTYSAVDTFIQEVRENHPDIELEEIGPYSLGHCYECMNSGKLLLTYDVWPAVRILLKLHSMNWSYKSSYGILYAENPSDPVRRLIEALDSKVGEQ
jgi:hypothetical protein